VVLLYNKNMKSKLYLLVFVSMIFLSLHRMPLYSKKITAFHITINVRFDFARYLKQYKWLKPGILYIPMPMNTYYQRFVSLQSRPAYISLEKKGRYNAARYDFSRGFPRYLDMKLIVLTRRVVRRPKYLKRNLTVSSRPGYFANFKNRWYDLDHPALMRLARQLGKNQKSVLAISKNIKRWVSKNISYAWPWPKPPYRKTSQVYEKRRGHCVHFSALFIALHRLNRIPVRMITGLFTSAGSGKGIVKDHSVAEIYDPATKSWFY